MDAASVRKLLCAAKAPLGRVGDVLVQEYKDDMHAFARGAVTLRGHVAPVEPWSRCKHRNGRGRCRSAISRGAPSYSSVPNTRSFTSAWSSPTACRTTSLITIVETSMLTGPPYSSKRPAATRARIPAEYVSRPSGACGLRDFMNVLSFSSAPSTYGLTGARSLLARAHGSDARSRVREA